MLFLLLLKIFLFISPLYKYLYFKKGFFNNMENIKIEEVNT